MRQRWYRDWGLTFRMVLTSFLLFVVYIIFLSLLYAYGVGFLVIAMFAGVFILAQFLFSDRLVLLTTGARIVNEREAPELHEIVSRLCMMANLPKPKIAIVDMAIPNAFATGRSRSKSVVAVTTGLLRTLNKTELEAVIGHELSHIKNRDMAVLTIASFLATIAWFIMRFSLYAGMWGRRRDNSAIIIAIISAVVWFVSFLLIRALSRYREFAADRGSVLITGNPGALKTALLKISGLMSRIPSRDLREVEGMNAFFIIPAISGETIMSLFSTHPPIKKRIEKLDELEKAMEGL
jgi:heat shock protein HtpX